MSFHRSIILFILSALLLSVILASHRSLSPSFHHVVIVFFHHHVVLSLCHSIAPSFHHSAILLFSRSCITCLRGLSSSNDSFLSKQFLYTQCSRKLLQLRSVGRLNRHGISPVFHQITSTHQWYDAACIKPPPAMYDTVSLNRHMRPAKTACTCVAVSGNWKAKRQLGFFWANLVPVLP